MFKFLIKNPWKIRFELQFGVHTHFFIELCLSSSTIIYIISIFTGILGNPGSKNERTNRENIFEAFQRHLRPGEIIQFHSEVLR